MEHKIKLKPRQIEIIAQIQSEKAQIEKREKELIDFILSMEDLNAADVLDMKLLNNELIVSTK